MKHVFSLLLLLPFSINDVHSEVFKDTTSVFFETDKHTLLKETKEALSEIVGNIPVSVDAIWTIQGHTDNRGSVAYNKALSNRRVQAVRSFLIDHGIDSTMIITDHHGELNPFVKNIDSKSMQLNRRVELSVAWYKFENLEELEREWRLPAQRFNINPSEEALIEGRSGSNILIPPNSLVNVKGDPLKEAVNFELTEAFTMEAFIMNGLATMSNDHMLESGGMLNIQATSIGGEAVFIDPNNPISISIPTDQVQKGMQLFTSDNGENWDRENQKVMDSIEYKLPPFPSLVLPEYQLPEYQTDLNTKPKRPIAPGYRKAPNEPRKESYVPKAKWYSALTEKEKREHFEKAYNTAYDQYLLDLEEYEAHNKQYKQDSIQYEKDKLYYKHDFALWKQKIDREKLEFPKSEAYIEATRKRDSIFSVERAKHRIKVEKWREKRDALRAEAFEKMIKMGRGNQRLLEQYAFSVNKLSWINVDRFYKQDMNDVIEVAVEDPDEIQERVMIVFTELNSVLPLAKYESEYRQRNIPKSADGEVFAYRVRNGKPEMFHEKLSADGKMKLEFKPCTFLEISSKLEEFNKTASSAS